MQEEGKQDAVRLSFENIFEPVDGLVQHVSMPFEDRTGSLNLVVTGGMGIVDSMMTTERPTAPWQHFNARPFVEMNFIMEGSLYQTHEGILHRYLYEEGYNNLLFNPNSWEKNELIGSGNYRVFGIHFVPAKMVALLSGYIPELAHLAEKIERGDPFVLHAPGNFITTRIKYIIDGIWQCPEPIGLRKLYLESKILELLSLQCAALIGKEVAGGNRSGISCSDKEKLYYARDIMLRNLGNPPSLSELSRQCGLNEFKLKKYFMQVFQTSVFSFVQTERLEEAKRMIYQGGKNISEIAYELGYAHPQHFHRAFKKRFGITPKALLK
jgi:AraC family transcriptional regulator, transcriptional activator of the genes for pyochelin and ferripyochelin receptors